MKINLDIRKNGRGLYRSRHGVILGVCRGIAEYFDFSLRWTRIIVLAAFLFTGFWPVAIAYLILALVMKPAPALPFSNEGETEFYNSYASSRTMALNRLKRTFDGLEKRLRRMEDHVTSDRFQWENRVKN